MIRQVWIDGSGSLFTRRDPLVHKFNSPPDWPEPPSAGWRPPVGWQPDPAWPAAPKGWRFWLISDDGHRVMARTLLVALDLALRVRHDKSPAPGTGLSKKPAVETP